MKRLTHLLILTAVLAWGSVSLAPASPTDDRTQQLLKRFPDADLNRDGTLTTDEFRQYRGSERSAGATPVAPAATLPTEKSAGTGRVRIQITTGNPVPINPRIYGINCAEMFIFDLVQKPEYLAALGDMQFHSFLFPGGSSYHHPTGSGGFNMKDEEIALSKHGTEHRANKVGSPDFFQQYVGFMKPMGGHAVFIPNIPNGTVAELDWYMGKMADAHVPVDTVVLGMEVQLGAFRFETSAAYVEKIKPYVAYLREKHPEVRIVGWSTPVGRRSALPESFHGWNQEVAKVPGLDGFAQYGWTEFGGAALRQRGSGETNSPEQRLAEYDRFVESFPEREIKPYAEDWGADKKMFLLQWGTHADRNTVLEGLHSVNFLFFMTEYNAAHANYFEAATWSVPLMSDLTSGKRRGAGDGVTYQKDIALWSSYLYVKTLRDFYSGDKSLLSTSVSGVPKDGAMEVVKVLAAAGADGKKYLCILNRGPSIALESVTVDGKPVVPDADMHVEMVSGDTLTATGAQLKTFAGDKHLGSMPIEPYSVTTLALP
jgi:hypothetical protein